MRQSSRCARSAPEAPITSGHRQAFLACRTSARTLMPGLHVSSSASSPARAGDAPYSAELQAAVRSALVEAETVAGAYADTPVRFIPLMGSGTRVVADLGPGGPGAWMLVACRNAAEIGHQVHLQERCLTAAQRFTLALWTDGVEAVWVQEGLPDEGVFRSAGVELGTYAPLGIVWCPEA